MTSMRITKQKTAHFLRKMNLLQFADNMMLIYDIIKNKKSNRLFLKNYPDFIVPPYFLAYDAYNHTNWQSYYETGLSHSRLISDLLIKNIHGDEIRVCEWGCGPGRVIRHLEKISGFDRIRLFGSDYNEHSIEWCKNNLKKIHFSTNDLEPPWNIENGYFDCLYAISIFTHLSERMHYVWIDELFKKIKPNGVLIFTTHGDTCAQRLLPFEKTRYDSGQLVIKDRVKEGKKFFLSYQPPEFVKKKLLKNYFIIKHISNPIEYQLDQEVWVAKKGDS